MVVLSLRGLKTRGYGGEALIGPLLPGGCCFNPIYDVCKSMKDLKTESGLQHFYEGFTDPRWGW
jgi:hypothetical protein